MSLPRLASITTLATLGVAATALVASPAHADSNAPGACDCGAAAPVEAPAAAGWDGTRWGVSLRLGSLTLHPDASPDATTDYGGGGVQVRYRLGARWELEVTSDGYSQPEDQDRSQVLSLATLGARFHLTPYRRWDWYLLAGVGGAREVSRDMAPADAPAQGVVALGGGVERRFGHFGISAELRAVGVAAPDGGDVAAPVAGTMRAPGGGAAAAPADGTSGGGFTIAATYHF
ncbi:MAG: hypothetical protein H6709_09485 [Kofleriaceae bacterium]|nr:hypothetical protein [Kofleriaceae bacterium]MCB9572303.1 hypothetical protein [Kofleriaceae bacterium]